MGIYYRCRPGKAQLIIERIRKMKKPVKELIISAIISFLFLLIFAAACFYATSPEVWYADQHDSKCEQAFGEKDCKCYDRLIRQENSGVKPLK